MNLYLVLGVRREATTDDIKRAYRRLARKFHPDVNPGDRAAAQRFRQIAEAYDVLIDPDRRRAYDEGQVVLDVAETSFEFKGFDFGIEADGHRAATFSELFGDVLRGPARLAPERGADLHERVTLAFEDAIRGTRRSLTLTRLERCAPCRGHGVLAGPPGPCAACEGQGVVRGGRGHMVFSRTCPACGGAGVVRHRCCAACGGEGVGVRTDTVAVDLPPGLTDGTLVSVPGQGHAGRSGWQPGDLQLTVAVDPHPFYRREGDDVLVEVPVAVHEAALGARIDVPSPDGPVRLRVPPGTAAGQSFRLRERGVPSPVTGRRGDLVVSVRIVLPKVIDERSKELLRQFGEINTENVRAGLGV
jgi:molecular chaperone DnaJ